MEVVSAAHGASGPLLGKLTALLAKECSRLKGVRREIRALKSELATMHAALREYTKLEDPNDQVKTWISLVRELAYDTEDVLDKFIHQLELGNGQDHGGFKEFFRKTARRLKTLGARRGIADQIDDLKVRINQVKDLKDSYKLSDTPCSSTSNASVDPRGLRALFPEESHLVGVDGPRDVLAKWMVEEGNDTTTMHPRKVLSIVGFGGLGKTTLANEVYRKIKGQFHCTAFVSVSQKPDIKNIIKDVISQVDGKCTTEDWDERKSIAKLRELLQDKRYLIIIDDVWSTQAWTNIKCAFPENNYSSRIIATTRIIDVAKSCCPGTDDRIHEMEALSDVHSRSLFLKRIFGSNDCPDMLKEVSDKILKKCGGLPLAIISISGLLSNRPAVNEEWEKVKRSIGSALENNKSLEGMRSILSLSYNDLPPNLKTCLLYLSIFPEDSVIKRKRLLRRWIAEGFISEERGKTQYEVADSYFYELINKNMVQPVYIGYDGKVQECRVHDMMLELIISKSAEDNFVTVVGGGQASFLNRQRIIRRLSIQYIDKELASALENEDLSHVRSLIVRGCIKHLPSLAKFEALRVLDFEGCNGLEMYDMNRMGNLLQLKYLGLKGTDMSELPSQIVMLGDLETLDFKDTSVQELPAGFVHLTKLQHLVAAGKTKIPSAIGNMSNLQTISGFNATISPADALEELGNLTRLSELSVSLKCEGDICQGCDAYIRMHEEKLFPSLHNLIDSYKLQTLQIYSDGDHSLELLESWSPMRSPLQIFYMSTGYYFRNIPKWIAPTLASLTRLEINLIELKEDDMQSLGELPALLFLNLCLKTGGYRITVQGTGFPSLKYIDISEGKGIYIIFVEGVMPKLECLELTVDVSVGRKDGFYLGLAHLLCLKSVGIWFHSEDALESEVIAARDAIQEEVDAHTNHPTSYISEYMRSN